LARIYEIKGDYAVAYQFFLKKEERSPRKDRLEIYQKVYEKYKEIGEFIEEQTESMAPSEQLITA